MSALGQKVRELRTHKRMTQQELAERAAVSHSLISALESNRRKFVTSQDVERLAAGLEIPPDELWGLIPGGKSDARYIPITKTPAQETRSVS